MILSQAPMEQLIDIIYLYIIKRFTFYTHTTQEELIRPMKLYINDFFNDYDLILQ